MSDAVHHPVFARVYERMGRRAEGQGAAEHRVGLLRGLRGQVVEVGAGTGLNFPHYPAAVDRVVAVEPEPYLRARATEAAARAPVTAEVVDGVADALPVGDAACDAAVTSLVLCSVPDQARALAELRRALRPGGELRFYEHVVADGGVRARVQRGLDAARIWPTVAGGCHLARDTLAAIAAAGFEVEHVRRFGFPEGPLGLPHVLGTARAPAG